MISKLEKGGVYFDKTLKGSIEKLKNDLFFFLISHDDPELKEHSVINILKRFAQINDFCNSKNGTKLHISIQEVVFQIFCMPYSVAQCKRTAYNPVYKSIITIFCTVLDAALLTLPFGEYTVEYVGSAFLGTLYAREVNCKNVFVDLMKNYLKYFETNVTIFSANFQTANHYLQDVICKKVASFNPSTQIEFFAHVIFYKEYLNEIKIPERRVFQNFDISPQSMRTLVLKLEDDIWPQFWKNKKGYESQNTLVFALLSLHLKNFSSIGNQEKFITELKKFIKLFSSTYYIDERNLFTAPNHVYATIIMTFDIVLCTLKQILPQNLQTPENLHQVLFCTSIKTLNDKSITCINLIKDILSDAWRPEISQKALEVNFYFASMQIKIELENNEGMIFTSVPFKGTKLSNQTIQR